MATSIGYAGFATPRDDSGHDDAIVAAADALIASPTFRAECLDESPELSVEACAALAAQRAYDRANFANDAFDNLRRLVRMYEASDREIAARHLSEAA